MNKHIITFILSIANIIGIIEIPLYYPFIAFFLLSSSLSMLYEVQISMVVSVLVSVLFYILKFTVSIQKIIIISLLMLISFIGKKNNWVYSTLLVLVPGLMLMNNYIFLSIVLLLLIPLLVKIGEVRSILLAGVLYLVSSSVLYIIYPSAVTPISTISYFYLVVGVIGILVENKRVRSRFIKYLTFFPATLVAIMFGFTYNSSFFYWTANSLYFNYLYLPWIYGIGYNSNQHFLVGWLVGYIISLIAKSPLITAEVFLGIFVFLSGVISFLVFTKLGLKYPLLLSLIYQFNVFNPAIHYSPEIFAYAFLPLALFFVERNKGLLYSITTLATATSLPIFLTSIIIPAINRKYNFLAYSLGLNAFWLIPYLVYFNVNNLAKLSTTYLIFSILFISITLLMYYFEFKRNDILYVFLISFVFLLLGINTAPLIILYSLLLFGSIKNYSVVSTVLLLSLLIISASSFLYGMVSRYNNVTYYNYSLNKSVGVGIYGFGIVSNMSSLDLASSGIPVKSINYTTKYFVINNTIFKNNLYLGFPIPAIPNYTPQLRFIYAYTNSGVVDLICSPFKEPLGIVWYSLGPSELVLAFPSKIQTVNGINATIINNTITIFSSNNQTLILAGNITVDGKPIFSSYYKPKIITEMGIGYITEEIISNVSIYLPINGTVSINGKSFSHPVILPQGKYVLQISDEKLEYLSLGSILISLLSIILLIRRFKI
ncbi:MAG: hypothetical protein QXD91_04430 [Saccharolobus sp.]